MKMFLALLLMGLATAIGVLASATAEPVNSFHYLPRDIWLSIGALIGPAVSYYGAGLVAKPAAMLVAMLVAPALLCLGGCAGGDLLAHVGSVGGTYNTNTGEAGVNVTLKEAQERIKQAIACEKAAIAAEMTSYKDMTADEKITHDKYRKAHKDRLKALEHGQWVEPINEGVQGSGFGVQGNGPSDPPLTPPVAEIVNLTQATGPPDAPKTWGFFVGINKFKMPGSDLKGCVNDAIDIANLAAEYGMTAKTCFRLNDEQATTTAYKDTFRRVVRMVRPGDRFIWWNSSHGAPYPGADGLVHQVICPHDFDWTPEHMLADTEIREILSELPKGSLVLANGGSDSCNSGDELMRVALRTGDRAKTMPNMPPEIAKKIEHMRLAGIRKLTDGELNIGFISGCGAEETSADTQDDNGRPCGAMTNCFLKVIRKPGNDAKPLSEVVKQMNDQLRRDGYSQHPEAGEARRNAPFLQPVPKVVTPKGIKPVGWIWNSNDRQPLLAA